MLNRVAVNALVNIELIPVFVGELSGVHASTNVRIAHFGNWRVFIDCQLMVLLEVRLHELIVKGIFSLAHTAIGERVILDGKQTAYENHKSEASRTKLDWLEVRLTVGH